MKKILDQHYGPEETDLYDLYLPENESFDLLIWFHGGGLESGDRKSAVFAEELVENGFAVASCEYRMYPKAHFPEFLEDAARAVAFFQKEMARLSPGGRLFVSGQSAGAYITVMLALDAHYLKEAGADYQGIAGFLSDSAQMTTHFNVLRERGVDTRYERIDEAAPFFHLTEKAPVKNLLLICYEEDIPCRPEQTALFYQSLRRLLPECHVVWHTLPGTHCIGSVRPDASGHYPFCRLAVPFMNETPKNV